MCLMLSLTVGSEVLMLSFRDIWSPTDTLLVSEEMYR